MSSASYHFSPKKKVVVWKNREDRSVNWFSCDTFNNKKRDLSIILYRRMHLLPKTAWYTLFSSVMTMKDDVKALWQASETSSFSWSSEETSMAKVCTLEYSIDLSENWVIRKIANVLFRTSRWLRETLQSDLKKKSPPFLSMKTSAVEGKSSELSPWYHFPNLLIKYPLAFGDLKLTHTQIWVSKCLFTAWNLWNKSFFGYFSWNMRKKFKQIITSSYIFENRVCKKVEWFMKWLFMLPLLYWKNRTCTYPPRPRPSLVLIWW